MHVHREVVDEAKGCSEDVASLNTSEGPSVGCHARRTSPRKDKRNIEVGKRCTRRQEMDKTERFNA
jgi:hypothetical protein